MHPREYAPAGPPPCLPPRSVATTARSSCAAFPSPQERLQATPAGRAARHATRAPLAGVQAELQPASARAARAVVAARLILARVAPAKCAAAPVAVALTDLLRTRVAAAALGRSRRTRTAPRASPDGLPRASGRAPLALRTAVAARLRAEGARDADPLPRAHRPRARRAAELHPAATARLRRPWDAATRKRGAAQVRRRAIERGWAVFRRRDVNGPRQVEGEPRVRRVVKVIKRHGVVHGVARRVEGAAAVGRHDEAGVTGVRQDAERARRGERRKETKQARWSHP